MKKSKLVLILGSWKFRAGLFFTGFSYSSFLLPEKLKNVGSLSFLLFAFILGVIYICEAITLVLKGKSLLFEIKKNRKNLFAFLIVSSVGAAILEIVVKWLGKLWIYPFYPGIGFAFYFVTFVPAFAAYWLLITESYLATKAVTDYLHKGKKIVGKLFSFEHIFYKLLGLIGILSISASILLGN